MKELKRRLHSLFVWMQVGVFALFLVTVLTSYFWIPAAVHNDWRCAFTECRIEK